MSFDVNIVVSINIIVHDLQFPTIEILKSNNVTRYFVKSDGYNTIWAQIQQAFITLSHQTLCNDDSKEKHFTHLKKGMALCFHCDGKNMAICNNSQLARALEYQARHHQEKNKLCISAHIFITTFNVYPTVENALLDVSNLAQLTRVYADCFAKEDEETNPTAPFPPPSPQPPQQILDITVLQNTINDGFNNLIAATKATTKVSAQATDFLIFDGSIIINVNAKDRFDLRQAGNPLFNQAQMKCNYTVNRQIQHCAGNATINVTVPVQSRFYPIGDLYKFITIDGHFFNLTPRDDRTKTRLTTKFPILSGHDPYNPYELQLWYDTCVTFCADCSIYLPPWLTLQTSYKLHLWQRC